MKPYTPARLPIKSLPWHNWIRLIGHANAELARFDGTVQGIINPSILLSPLTTQEAVLSSKIEGTQATLEEVLEFEATQGKNSDKAEDIREIINYRKALLSAVEMMQKRPISLNLIREIHSILLDNVRGQKSSKGNFRTIQNWIGKPGSGIEQATYVPPEPQTLMEHLGNLEKYIHFDEEDKLVQLAIIHAQFELIHPFLDGNGRVGRILIPLLLFAKGLLSSPIFYLSDYLEKNREIYYEKLRAISENNDWNSWIQFFLTAIMEQAKTNNQKTKNILVLYEKMKKKIIELTRSPFAINFLDSLFYQPVFTTTGFIEKSNTTKSSSARILNTLLKENILITLVKGRGSQPVTLMFPELMKITEGI